MSRRGSRNTGAAQAKAKQAEAKQAEAQAEVSKAEVVLSRLEAAEAEWRLGWLPGYFVGKSGNGYTVLNGEGNPHKGLGKLYRTRQEAESVLETATQLARQSSTIKPEQAIRLARYADKLDVKALKGPDLEQALRNARPQRQTIEIAPGVTASKGAVKYASGIYFAYKEWLSQGHTGSLDTFVQEVMLPVAIKLDEAKAQKAKAQ